MRRLDALRPLLEAFLAATPYRARRVFDPVELPHRFEDPRDIEVVALLSASLAYGRADLFKPKVEGLLASMGPSPARYLAEIDVGEAARLLEGFVYRFNVAADLAVLLLGMGAVLRSHGSLEALFLENFSGAMLFDALCGFTAGLRSAAPRREIHRALGRERGLGHLLPSPLKAGAAKRLNLFLRWMVRGPDAVDFGIWKSVPPSVLLIPLDTHVGRIARLLGLTARKDLSWRTAEEITARLRYLDADDPVRYDFALCHYGMSGICPSTPIKENCARCLLRPACRVGRRCGLQAS
ncbi:MAG: TIGR02757 family protein [Myxococcota bacterium]